MNRSRNTLTTFALAFCAVIGCSTPLQSEVLFEDGFESGDLSKTMGGSRWTNNVRVRVVDDIALTGDYSARFSMNPPGRGQGDDAWAELRFILDRPSPTIWVRYDMYIPSNYTHRIPDAGSSNNKGLLYLWGGGRYQNAAIAGSVSFWPSEMRAEHDAGDIGDSYVSLEIFQDGKSLGHKFQTQRNPGFTTIIDVGEDSKHDKDLESDSDRWMTFYMQYTASDYAPTAADRGNGVMGIWKCHMPCAFDDLTEQNALIYWDKLPLWGTDSREFLEGYILGWANSGFLEWTQPFLDNVVIGTEKADILREPLAPSLKPLPPVLEQGEWLTN